MSDHRATYGTHEDLHYTMHQVAAQYGLSVTEVQLLPWSEFCRLANGLQWEQVETYWRSRASAALQRHARIPARPLED